MGAFVDGGVSAKDFEKWDLERTACISHNHNLIIINAPAPGAKVGVIDDKTGEVLLYGEVDGLGHFEEEVPLEEGETRLVSIRVRWPEEPIVEKKVSLSRPKPEYAVPREDWMDKLYV